MKTATLFIAVVLLSLTSCRTESSKKIEHPFTGGLCHYDSINMIVDGLKQGVWILPSSKDTVVYVNDTMYSVTAPMTAREVMNDLKTRRPEEFISYDSLVLNSH